MRPVDQFVVAGVFCTGLVLVVLCSGLQGASPHGDANRYQRHARSAVIGLKDAFSVQECFSSISETVDRRASAPLELVAAVVAVENAARPQVRRAAERAFAEIHLRAFGLLPDISLGIGQVKVSTARLVNAVRRPGNPPSDATALLADLMDPCESARMVRAYLDILSPPARDPALACTGLVAALREYNGQSTRSATNDMYVGVVLEAFHILSAHARNTAPQLRHCHLA